MSLKNTAADSAKRILGFYDAIPAMDQKAFAAGLVEILSSYPQSVLDRAASPSRGLPSIVQYPNLAKFKKHLDEWADEYYADTKRREIASRKRLPEPEVDPQVKMRVASGFEKLSLQLKRGIGPSTIAED